jgi:hypothetical protein
MQLTTLSRISLAGPRFELGGAGMGAGGGKEVASQESE